MKKKSILTHILVPTLLVLAIGLIGQAVFMGSQSDQLAGEVSRRVLDEAANRYAAEFQAVNSRALGALEAYVPMLLQAGGSKDGRDKAIELMQQYVHENDGVLGMWTAWQSDAFDGHDLDYADTIYHDHSGVFMPYVFRASGGLGTEALALHGKSNYMAAANAGHTVVAEPYSIELEGKDRLLYSISIPIMKQGKAVGVLGFDLDLLAMSAAMDTAVLGEGYVFTVSPGGLIATHPQKDLVMQRYSQGWSGAFAGGINDVLSTGTAAFIEGEAMDKRMAISAVAIPVGGSNWAVCVAAPYSAMLAPAATFNLKILAACVLLFALAIGTLALATHFSLQDVRKLTVVAGALANGNFRSIDIQLKDIEKETHNESELLKRSLAGMVAAMKRQYAAVKHMAAGDFSSAIRPRSANDSMGLALRGMSRNVNSMLSDLTDKVRELNRSAGTLNGDVSSLAEQSRRGAKLADSLIKTARQKPEAEGFVAGQTDISAKASDKACTPIENARDIPDALNSIAGNCKDISVRLAREAGSSKGVHRRRLGRLAVAAKDIFDLCNSLYTQVQGPAGQSEPPAEQAIPMAGSSLQAMQLAAVTAQSDTQLTASQHSRLAQNLRRITQSVDTDKAEKAAMLAEGLAGKAGELDGIMCWFKLRPRKQQGKKLELKKTREHVATLPAEPALKTVASAGR